MNTNQHEFKKRQPANHPPSLKLRHGRREFTRKFGLAICYLVISSIPAYSRYSRAKSLIRVTNQIDGGKLCWIDLQDYTRKLSQVFSKISLDIFWRA
jgi:hypothetical protein